MIPDCLSGILRRAINWCTTRMTASLTALSSARDVQNKPTPWPLSFRMRSPQVQEKALVRKSKHADSRKVYWSHLLYRGPWMQTVRIDYCKNRTTSEIIAQKFLDEKVLGFDMEWEMDSDSQTAPLQEKISLIQIASESRIALFHIGLHVGSTPEELIAPSLRKIIESPHITKTGVAINNADGKRLRQFFALQPRGLFELSHLHRLVKHGVSSPNQVNKNLVALAKQVEEHLHLPLSKGRVRRSNWSKPLSQKQVNYAASDAYAGFMLYHCMEAKRTRMDPVPPLPRAHADSCQSIQLPEVDAENFSKEPQVEKDKVGSKLQETYTQATADEQALPAPGSAHEMLFRPAPKGGILSSSITTPTPQPGQRTALRPTNPPNSLPSAPQRPTPDLETLSPSSRRLSSALMALRVRLSRTLGRPAESIASDMVIRALVISPPQNVEELHKVIGIESFTQATGAAGIELLKFLAKYTPVKKAAAPQIVEHIDLTGENVVMAE